MLFCQELARPSQCGLDLVQNQNNVMLITDRSDFSEVSIWWNDNPCLSLDRFHQKSHRIRSNRLFKGCSVSERNDLEAGCKGTKSVSILLFATETDDSDGSAVEVVLTNDNFSLVFRNPFHLVTPLANCLDHGLHRFGPTVHG